MLIDSWSNVTVEYLADLFSGEDDGLEQLDAYIRGGSWSYPGFTNSRPGMQSVMGSVLYGGMIQRAWAEHKSTNPVIIFQEGNDNTNPLSALEDDLQGISDEVSLNFFFPQEIWI